MWRANFRASIVPNEAGYFSHVATTRDVARSSESETSNNTDLTYSPLLFPTRTAHRGRGGEEGGEEGRKSTLTIPCALILRSSTVTIPFPVVAVTDKVCQSVVANRGERERSAHDSYCGHSAVKQHFMRQEIKGNEREKRRRRRTNMTSENKHNGTMSKMHSSLIADNESVTGQVVDTLICNTSRKHQRQPVVMTTEMITGHEPAPQWLTDLIEEEFTARKSPSSVTSVASSHLNTHAFHTPITIDCIPSRDRNRVAVAVLIFVTNLHRDLERESDTISQIRVRSSKRTSQQSQNRSQLLSICTSSPYKIISIHMCIRETSEVRMSIRMPNSRRLL